jgi:oligosaccharide repeat unit polymerase
VWSNDGGEPHPSPGSAAAEVRAAGVRLSGAVCLLGAAACVIYLALYSVVGVVFWATLVCALWLALLGHEILFRPADLTEPIHWINATYLVLFGLHPLFLYFQGGLQTPYHGQFDITPTYSAAISIGLGSMLLVNIAYDVVARGRRGRSTPRLRGRASSSPDLAEASIRRLRSLGWLMLFLGLIGVAASVTSGPSPTRDLGNSGAGGTAYVYNMPYLLIPASLLFLVVHAHGRKRADLITGCLVSLAYSGFLVTQGARTGVLLAIAAPAVFLAVQWRVRIPRLVVLVLVALTVFTFSALRDANSPDSSFSRSLTESVQRPDLVLQDTFTGNDTEMVDALALEMQISPSQIAHGPGITVISTLGAPVPRVLWPDKPLTADVILNRVLFNRGVNEASVAYSMLGEAYFDSGILGVVVSTIVFGAVYGFLVRRRDTWSTSPLRAALFAVAVVLTPVVIRGILAYSLAIAAFVAGPLLVASFLVSSRRSHEQPEAFPSGSS